MNIIPAYNPFIHHRRSIRLKGYDYSQAGLYFITCCCHNRVCRFGNIINEEMHLNQFGEIAHNEWLNLPKRFPHFEMDVFQIMPNHMHGIIFLNDRNSCQNNLDDNKEQSQKIAPTDPSKKIILPVATVGEIVGAYKSLVYNGCLDIYKSNNQIMGKLWQRNFYEHIIKSEESYKKISNYIITNPGCWKIDKFYQ